MEIDTPHFHDEHERDPAFPETIHDVKEGAKGALRIAGEQGLEAGAALFGLRLPKAIGHAIYSVAAILLAGGLATGEWAKNWQPDKKKL